MKKPASNREMAEESEMLSEYDFRGGVRGKHADAYQQGHSVRVHHPDGTTTVQYFTPADRAVILEPDVQEYFPDSQAVNRALRTLIELIPTKRQPRSKKKKD
jgi:hypothetical protein